MREKLDPCRAPVILGNTGGEDRAMDQVITWLLHQIPESWYIQTHNLLIWANHSPIRRIDCLLTWGNNLLIKQRFTYRDSLIPGQFLALKDWTSTTWDQTPKAPTNSLLNPLFPRHWDTVKVVLPYACRVSEVSFAQSIALFVGLLGGVHSWYSLP